MSTDQTTNSSEIEDLCDQNFPLKKFLSSSSFQTGKQVSRRIKLHQRKQTEREREREHWKKNPHMYFEQTIKPYLIINKIKDIISTTTIGKTEIFDST